MNKAELIETYMLFLERNGFQAKDVLVGAGGALVMMGLRENTEDIDVSVSKEVFEEYLKRPGAEMEVYPATGKFPERKTVRCEPFPEVDLHIRMDEEIGFMHEGVFIYEPAYNLHFKCKLNRPKDQMDIIALYNALNKTTEIRASVNLIMANLDSSGAERRAKELRSWLISEGYSFTTVVTLQTSILILGLDLSILGNIPEGCSVLY